MPLGGKGGKEKCSMSTVAIIGDEGTIKSVSDFELKLLSCYSNQNGFWNPET